MLKGYLKRELLTFLVFLFLFGIFILVAALYDMPRGGILYAVVLCSLMGMIFWTVGFFRYCSRVREISDANGRMEFDTTDFPEVQDCLEIEYKKIIDRLVIMNKKINSASDSAMSDMIDYYTMWVHQIKTPIAAMKLMLDTEEYPSKADMKMEIFKIEQYVEMVLQYLRLGSDETDFLFKKQTLDNIIKDAVKKYSIVFIRKKIALKYEPIYEEVITDEKWLGFVIEQIISNGLKYTKKGSISIYMDEENPKELIIEDTGIGIRKEDIPRVFDRGYTGYNGRNDKKSTGIGLYLCSSILKKLGASITIESEIGKGTKVRIDMTQREMQYE